MGSAPSLDLFKDIKAIVFDLDDTLYLQADYKKSGFLAVSKWLQINLGVNYDVSISYLHDIMEEHGPSYPYIFNMLCEKLKVDEKNIKKLVRAFLDHDPEIQCFDGVKPLLRKLHEQYKLGLLTDGREETQIKKVTRLGLESFFDVILYSDSMSLEKPAPQLYEYFESRFNLPPHCLCYVGDNPAKDFFEAKRRGWLTIRVKCGEYSTYQSGSSHSAVIDIDSVISLACLTSLQPHGYDS